MKSAIHSDADAASAYLRSLTYLLTEMALASSVPLSRSTTPPATTSTLSLLDCREPLIGSRRLLSLLFASLSSRSCSCNVSRLSLWSVTESLTYSCQATRSIDSKSSLPYLLWFQLPVSKRACRRQLYTQLIIVYSVNLIKILLQLIVLVVLCSQSLSNENRLRHTRGCHFCHRYLAAGVRFDEKE